MVSFMEDQFEPIVLPNINLTLFLFVDNSSSLLMVGFSYFYLSLTHCNWLLIFEPISPNHGEFNVIRESNTGSFLCMVCPI